MIHERQSDLLLSDRFSKVSAHDMLIARPLIERLHGPFEAHVRAMQPSGAIEIRAAHFGQVAVGTFAFGQAVDIVPHALADAIVVTTTIRGQAGIKIGGATFRMSTGETIIAHEPDNPVFLYQPETEVIKVRFRRSRLEEAVARTQGTMRRGQLRFATAMSDADTAVRWIGLLRFLVSTMNASARRPPSTGEFACIEELLMATLLNNQSHNYAGQALDSVREDAASYFGRAVAYIHQDLASELSLSTIAAAACCSPRSIARAFKQASEATPMQYVHQLRLARIRAELTAPASQAKTVAELAFEWGYRHLGEFNRQYRAAFGETPSQTRRGAFQLLA